MNKGRILVVEDDFDISNMLRIYFGGQGYEVQVAPRGNDAARLNNYRQDDDVEFANSTDGTRSEIASRSLSSGRPKAGPVGSQ